MDNYLVIFGVMVVLAILIGIAIESYKFYERRKVGHSILYCIIKVGR